MVQRSGSVKEFEFVVEGFLVEMLTSNNTDKASKAELMHRAGPVNTLLFTMRYLAYVWKTYPVQPDSEAGKVLQERASALLGSPIRCYHDLKEEAGWVAGLPAVVLLIIAHARDVLSGK